MTIHLHDLEQQVNYAQPLLVDISESHSSGSCLMQQIKTRSDKCESGCISMKLQSAFLTWNYSPKGETQLPFYIEAVFLLVLSGIMVENFLMKTAAPLI